MLHYPKIMIAEDYSYYSFLTYIFFIFKGILMHIRSLDFDKFFLNRKVYYHLIDW